ncbi:MAG: primosomal protein N' [Proteobacteria bacterium]|nr:MAG: primosomal protein N' [Pseudomonadota bacterium]
MYYLDVAVPVALNQTFTYTSKDVLLTGIRVKVSFGRRRLVGVVVGVGTVKPKNDMELKAIEEVIDAEPVYSEILLSLARWLSSYYLHPIGEVLRSMLPASLVKKEKTQYRLSPLGSEVREDETHSDRALIRFLWTRRMAFSQKNLKAKLTKWQEETGAKVTLKKLEKDGLIIKEAIDKTHGRLDLNLWSEKAIEEAEALIPNKAPELTEHQVRVTNTIIEGGFEKAEGRKAYLLHGVTGAGKTEVYLKLITQALKTDPANQVMVLVPEIALTPQMTRVFSARFPGQVAVVHSAMAPAERWQELQSIRTNQRQILIGPRSAVFAAFERLCLLIVDEEHDSSYKQTTGLTYNGRDVAVMRAHLEGKPIVLGSATPSLESYANAVQGKYQLLELMERANRRPLPAIEFITSDVQKGFARKLSGVKRAMPVVDLPIDDRILDALRANLAEGKQAMVLVNRRGFAYFLFSVRDRKAVACPNCSISLTVHEKSTILRCHYCDFQKSIDRMISADAADGYVLVGYGSEQMEQFLRDGIPGARIQRVDSDSVGPRDALPQILDKFREGEIDVLVGTQMLAKGHDFAKVTLIAILEIDQTLNLPDFRAGERTFQLMVQAAGRAGRGEWSGHVMIQTQRADHPVLKAGLNQSYSEFWQDQIQFRKAHNYPPFSRMIVFEFSSSKRDKLLRWTGEVEKWVGQKLKNSEGRYKQLSIMGPSIPPLETIRGRSRRTLLLMSSDRQQLWGFAKELMESFDSPSGDLRLRVDVDPQSLM